MIMNSLDNAKHSILSSIEDTLREGDVEDIKILINSFAEQKIDMNDFINYVNYNDARVNAAEKNIRKICEKQSRYISELEQKIETIETQLKNVLIQNDALLKLLGETFEYDSQKVATLLTNTK